MTTVNGAANGKVRKRGGLRWFQILFIMGFVGVMAFAFKATLLSSEGYATELGPLRFTSKVDGPAAMAQVSDLHGKDISLVSASIIYYGNGQEHATVWVGKASSDQNAEGLLQRMAGGIKASGGGFTNLRQVEVNGQAVYQVDGPDGQHFFYAHHDKVVWLIVQAREAKPILSAALEVF